ncbi:MAG: S8 family peptidase [Solirubrobacteraceae bacterium]|nr:S8 family peptidase [Solirubrobacteraceae bacterium]
MSASRTALLSAAAAFTMAAAATPAHAGSLIVGFDPGEQSETLPEVVDEVGASSNGSAVAGLNARVLDVPGSVASARTALADVPGVRYVEPNRILRISAPVTPNDPKLGELFGLNNLGLRAGFKLDADIDAPEAWGEMGFAQSGWPKRGGAKVAIIDTGISPINPDLVGKVIACGRYETKTFFGLPTGGSRFSSDCGDGNGHGTHVAGTIAATANNAYGVAGVAPNADLIICRGLTGAGSGTTADIANCITWAAAQGADIISMSLGGVGGTAIQDAVRRAWNNGSGALVVAAAGNAGNTTTSYPAGYAEAVSVGATTAADTLATFSQRNADVEISAPGQNIVSTWPGTGNAFKTLSGTSMATPHVAGVAALVKAQNPAFRGAELRARLTSTVDDLGAVGRDSSFGFGRVNAARAVGGTP